MANSINAIQTPVARSLQSSQEQQNKAIQRLSTMLRINSARDDAAGIAIFDRLSADIIGSNQGIRNANDGISYMQTAEGGLGQMTDNLQRMRELAVQASNSTLSASDRSAIQAEVNQLSQSNAQITDSTSFAGQKVFQGGGQTLSFQVGPDAGAGNQIQAEVQSMDGLNSVQGGSNGIDVSNVSSAQDAISRIDADLEAIAQQRASFGAVQNRLGAAISNAEEYSINSQAARSRIGDADVAKEMSRLIQGQILSQASTASYAQANQSRKMVLNLLGGG
jgi:flagellin